MLSSKPNLDDKSTWLVTGAAGFIGSHLVKKLLDKGQRVVGLDNLSACGRKNLDLLELCLTDSQKSNFSFIRGDIRDGSVCEQACTSVDYVLHHAAIGSVPRSFDDAVYVDSVNVGGFITVLKAAAKCGVKKFAYASSSAVYGDYTDKENQEGQPLKPLSPYAVGKYANELYAKTLGGHYGINTVGLRYFNIFGPHQDPNGAYAAVIPRWIDTMQKDDTIEIYGDGKSVRDFCFIDDVMDANILAATSDNPIFHQVYNIASGQQTSLNDLFFILKSIIGYKSEPAYRDARQGDIKISCANISHAQNDLSFFPQYTLEEGLKKTTSA